jgi:hypothetical protein
VTRLLAAAICVSLTPADLEEVTLTAIRVLRGARTVVRNHEFHGCDSRAGNQAACPPHAGIEGDTVRHIGGRGVQLVTVGTRVRRGLRMRRLEDALRQLGRPYATRSFPTVAYTDPFATTGSE